MNILLAIGLLTGVYMVHYEHPRVFDQPAVIGWVMQDSPRRRPESSRATASSGWTASEPHLGEMCLQGAAQPQPAA